MVPIFNMVAVLVAALVPSVIGLLWYSPMLFGNAWRKQAGVEESRLASLNLPIFLLISLVLSFLVAVLLVPTTIHQMGVMGVLAGEEGFGEPTSAATGVFNDMMAKYGDRFRSFKHGALHGTILGLTGFMAMFGMVAMRERRGWRYIWINGLYWVVCLAIMGGIVCGWTP